MKTNSRNVLQLLFDELLKPGQPNLNFEVFFERYSLRNDQLWMDYAEGKATKNEVRLNRFIYTFNDLSIKPIATAHTLASRYVELGPLQNTVFPHTQSVLTRLGEKYPLHLISNGFSEVQHIKLKQCNLQNHFKSITLSDDCGVLKPNKKIFDTALITANAKAESSVYIGDNYATDVIGATQAGWQAVLMDYNKIHQKNDSVDYQVCQSLKELLKLFVTLNG
jgi:putative hydrolase of the HAD superfamily